MGKILHVDTFNDRDSANLRKIVTDKANYYKLQGYKTEINYTSFSVKKKEHYLASIKVRSNKTN
jgi:hypothetical protein